MFGGVLWLFGVYVVLLRMKSVVPGLSPATRAAARAISGAFGAHRGRAGDICP